MIKFLRLERSDRPGKKYYAEIEVNGATRRIYFGDSNARDFTTHNALERDERKRLYLIRHKARENWKDPLTPGFWSRHLLWGDYPSVTKNLELIKKRFF